MKGIILKSRGQEEVFIYGVKYRKAVYFAEELKKFFVKVNGELVEVYKMNMSYTTK